MPRLVGASLWVVASLIFMAWVGLCAFHFRDDYRVSHVQGVWIATTEAARGGDLYPPIFDGEHYTGTRYMPLPILLNALAAAIVGDPVVGGKLLAATLMAALLTLVVFVLRRSSCPWPIAIGLAAMVVATDTGLQAGTTIGGDVLPVLLQTAALTVAARGRRPRSMVAAGCLSGCGIASKLTGMWAVLAVTTWLVHNRQWRRGVIFAVAGIGTAAVILGAVELLTAGRMSQHLLAFSLAGVHGAMSWLRGPNQVLYNLLGHASGAVVLLPLAAVGVVVAGRRQLSAFHISLGYAFLLLLVTYADVGTGPNQLLDVIVLTALVVGYLGARSADNVHAPAMVLTIALTVLWAAGLDLVRTVAFDVRTAIANRHASSARAADIVGRLVRPGDEVLAEDPSIYVALRRRPVVTDPFMMMRLERSHPQWVDPLVARIAARRFDLVVLVVPLEKRDLDYWWTDFHFGPRVAAALRSSYRADGTVGRYFLYRPRR